MRLRDMENMEKEQGSAARLLFVCSVVRESELSHLLASYVQNAHSLSLMHEKHSQAILLHAQREMWWANGKWSAYKCDVFLMEHSPASNRRLQSPTMSSRSLQLNRFRIINSLASLISSYAETWQWVDQSWQVSKFQPLMQCQVTDYV